jgi:hypothetical protein
MPFRNYRIVKIVDENTFVQNLQKDKQIVNDINKSKITTDEQMNKLREALLKIIRNNKSKYVNRPQIRNLKIILPEGSISACQFSNFVAIPGNLEPKLILYGGISSNLRCSMIHASTHNGKFEEHFPWKENGIALGRYGHSMHRFGKDQIIIFGGYIGTPRKDFAMSQQKLFNILGFFIYQPRFRSVRKLFDRKSLGPKPRKFHASCLLGGRFLIVFGGMVASQVTAKNELKSASLYDLWIFDLSQSKWYNCALSTRTKKLFEKGVIYHKMTVGYNYSITQKECLKGIFNKINCSKNYQISKTPISLIKISY